MSTILKKLRPDHWAWLHAKAAILVWAVVFYIYTPPTVSSTIHYVLVLLISVFMIVGVLMSVIGLFMAMSNSVHHSRRGTNLEIAGLWFCLTGPLVLFLTFLYLSIDEGRGVLSVLAGLAYGIFALLLVRLVIVTSFRKKASL